MSQETTIQAPDLPKELIKKFLTLEEVMNEVVLERHAEIHTGILAFLSGRNHLQLGPPGVAKSYLVDQFMLRIAGCEDEDSYFKWQLNKYTQPEELFGGPLFDVLRDQGAYKRNTHRKMPRAKVAFLDEVYKGSSSIINTLLLMIHEGEFYNHDDDPHIPLMTVFGASNEGPQLDAGLAAFHDRFMFRHEVEKVRDITSFMQMLTTPPNPEPEKIISLEDIAEAQALISQIVLPDTVLQALWNLRTELEKKDLGVSDRRFNLVTRVIQAEAFLNGNNIAEVSDTKPLQHIMWEDPANRDEVRKIVLDLADPLEKAAVALLEDLNKLFDDYKKAIRDSSNKVEISALTAETWTNLKEIGKQISSLEEEQEKIGRKCRVIEQLAERKTEFQKHIWGEGLKMKG
jgi:MoxR-like ATPase